MTVVHGSALDFFVAGAAVLVTAPMWARLWATVGRMFLQALTGRPVEQDEANGFLTNCRLTILVAMALLLTGAT